MRKIIERLIAILPAILLQILWYYIVYRILKDNNIALNIVKIIGMLLILNLIFEREESTYKILWIIIIFSFPVLGAWFFFFFGKGQSAKKLEKRLNESRAKIEFKNTTKPEIFEELKEDDERMYQTFKFFEDKTKFPIEYVEQAEYFPIGEDMFRDMLEEIRKAKKTIYLEYFIIKKGIFYYNIMNLLAEKAKEGVDVRLMYDDFGSIGSYSFKNAQKLRKEGIKVTAFNPLIFIRGALNNRDHRKMMIIDGNIVYSGGINLADEYINEKIRFGHWKDIGFKLKGNAAKPYVQMYIEFWNAFSKDKIENYDILKLEEKDYPNKDGYVFSYYDIPSDIEPTSYNIYVDIISQAKKYIYFYTPYLMLGETILNALLHASRRGVDIKIIVPGIPDKKFAYSITKSYYRTLAEAGIEIYTYTPGFLHGKSMIVDDKICAIGTVNLDFRSLFLHFENNSIFYKSSILNQVKKDYLETMQKSKLIKKEEIKKSYIRGFKDNLLKLVAPLF